MIDGTRIGLEIASRPAVRRLRRTDFLIPRSDSDADILEFVRRAGRTIFHPVGTCAMCTVVDAEAVRPFESVSTARRVCLPLARPFADQSAA